MTGKRKLFIGAAAAGVLLAAALVLLWSNLDSIVKRAIERYGSQAVGTDVRVARVALQPAKGKGAISGLTVANPRGFSAQHIIALGGIGIRLSPRTVTANPVVIDDIHVTAPRIAYEMNKNGASNIDALKKNLGADSPEKSGREDRRSARGGETRLRIRRLVIEKAQVDVHVAALGQKPRTITLKRLEMKNVGGAKGATPDIVAKEIVTAILSEVSREAGKAGTKRLLEKSLERMLQRR